MSNVLPPQAGLTVGDLIYRYRVEKQMEDDFKVTIGNKDKINGGDLFSYTDDWSGKNGNTILKRYPLDNIIIDRFGDGYIETEGDGSVHDPDVRYTFTYDECFVVLSNPECPGWALEYLKYLLDEGLIELNPEYDPDEVLALLENETDLEEESEEDEESKEDEEKKEEKDIEKLLSIADEKNKLADDVAQQAMLQALSQVAKINAYIAKEIQGGEYVETVSLQDKKISDNRSAARRMGLAQDKVHEEMISSQYE